MKKEGFIAIVLVLSFFIISLPPVHSVLQTVALVDNPDDSYAPFLNGEIEGDAADILSGDFCFSDEKDVACPESDEGRPADVCFDASNNEWVTEDLIEFHLEREVDSGRIEAIGGKEVRCLLNEEEILVISDGECRGEEGANILSNIFNSGTGDAGKNILRCEVRGRWRGFKLSHLSYNIDSGGDKYACEHPDIDGKWEEALYATGNACCGDDSSDAGYVGADAQGREWLCQENSPGNWQWQSPSQTVPWRVKTLGSVDTIFNNEEWFACDASFVGQGPEPPLNSDDVAPAAKFICADHGGVYRFVECCSTLYSNSGERAGSSCDLGNTFVERGFGRAYPGDATTSLIGDPIEQPFFDSPRNLDIDQLSITNWENFDELNVFYNVSEDQNIFLELFTNEPNPIFSVLLPDYVVNTPLLNKWSYARIPLPDELDLTNIATVRFRYVSTFTFSGQIINNRFELDRMFLVPKHGEVFFCSDEGYLKQVFDSKWLTDLDANIHGRHDEQVGKAACDAVPGFEWTGNACCGDDSTRFSTEYYTDVDAGCWNGNPIHLNESTTDVLIETAHNAASTSRVFFCPYDKCAYPTDSRISFTVSHSLSDYYNLSFVTADDRQEIDGNEATINELGVWEVDNVFQSTIFYDSGFHSCGLGSSLTLKSLSSQCSVKSVCSSNEVTILGLSSSSNAHATLPTENAPLSLCCNRENGLDNECGGSNFQEILKLSSSTNAHVQKPDRSGYGESVCVSGPDEVSLDCQYAEASPGQDYSCLFSITSGTNAHISRCDSGNENLYCKLSDSVNVLNPIVPFCSVLGDSFCSPDLGWTSVDETTYLNPLGVRVTFTAAERNTPKSSEPLGINSASCCPGNSCWNGEVCVADQSTVSDQNASEVYNEHRCVAGEWVVTPLVSTWDKSQNGYCPTAGQCLVDLHGDSSLNNDPASYYEGTPPQCINDNEAILDHLCDAGTWTTRTKFVAIELMDFVDSNRDITGYTLYCDNHENALVDTSYPGALDRILGLPQDFNLRTCFDAGDPKSCVNNFCVLDYVTQSGDNTHVLGVSLNKDVDNPGHSFLPILGHTNEYCNSVTGDNFVRCASSDDTTWYSSKFNAVIYSKDGVSLDRNSILRTALNWLLSIVDSTFAWLTGSSVDSPVQTDFEFIQKTTQFDRLYLSARGDKQINAIQEHVNQTSFIIAEYHNASTFDEDLCEYVRNKGRAVGIDDQSGVSVSSIECAIRDGTYHVFTQDEDAVRAWQEFTSTLRLSR